MYLFTKILLEDYFVQFEEGDIIDTPLPESLVERFYDSNDKGVDVVPLQTMDEVASVILYFVRRMKKVKVMSSPIASLILST